MPAIASVATPRRVRPQRRTSPLTLAAWKAFLQVAKPYWLGDQKRVAWTLLILLIALMLVETQFAVILNDKGGGMAAALAGKGTTRFSNAVYETLGVLVFAVPIHGIYHYMRNAFANQWRRRLTGRFLDGYPSDKYAVRSTP